MSILRKLRKNKEICASCQEEVDPKAPTIFVQASDGVVEIKLCDKCAEKLESDIMKARENAEREEREDRKRID